MLVLILGLVALIGLHMIPYFAAGFRANMRMRLGDGPYKGLFAVAVLASFAVIIIGWRGIDPGFVYVPPSWGMHVTPLFTLFAFLLFIASNAPTNIRRLVRHPQMTGVFLWAIGHLFSNGELRSVLLFGGFALWSVLAIIGANRRDEVWILPDKQSILKDIITVVLALAAYGGFFYFHEAIIGVQPFP